MASSPSHVVYTIVDTGDAENPFWQRIGAAWTNRDGSLNVKLNALPVNGELHIRKPKPKDES